MRLILSLLVAGIAGVAFANEEISSVECFADDYELTVSVNGTSAHSHLNKDGRLFNHYDGTVSYHLNKSNPPQHVWTITPNDRSGRRTVITTTDTGGHRHGEATYTHNPATSPVIFPEGSCHID